MSVYVTYDVVGHEGKLLGSLKCPWMSPMMGGGGTRGSSWGA